jgi:hypothetical protein
MGARTVLQQYRTQITLFPCHDAGIHYDVDTLQEDHPPAPSLNKERI